MTPPVWAGNSPHHERFGGTISVGVRGLLDALERIAASVLDNGFDAVLLVNGHGGNQSTIDDAVSIVGDANPEARALGLTYFELAEPFIHDVRDSETGGMAHAGEFETSLVLHLRPELVDESAIEATPMDEPHELAGGDLFEGGPLAVYRTFDECSANGAVGAPHLASAEKAAELFDRLDEALAEVLVDVHERAA